MAIKMFIALMIVCIISKVHPITVEETLVAPYAHVIRENIASTQLQQQINASATSIIANMATYDLHVRKITNQLLREYHLNIGKKVLSFKSNLNRLQTKRISSEKNIITKCVIEEGKLGALADEVNEQIKKCASVALSEMVNLISNSLNEAQTFMTIPQIIGKDIQRCGLSYNCRWDIVADAISEAIQVPPKVFALTAKIQSMVLRTVVSIDSCGLQGLKQITETSMGLLEDIFLCISDANTTTDLTDNTITSSESVTEILANSTSK